MSVNFVIIPCLPEEWAKNEYSYIKPTGNFCLDSHIYRAGLKSRWEQIDIRIPVSENYALEWNLPASRPNFGGLPGKLSSSSQIITIGTGSKESFLEFILWHRSFVRPEVNLYLLGQGYDKVIQIVPEITEQDIVNYTGIVD